MMFRSIVMATASLIFAASAALAQRGTILSIDAENKSLVVKVAEMDHKVDAKKVSLLDSEGKAISLSDFAVKEKVIVVMTNQQITSIQKVKDQLPLAAQEPTNATVVSVAVDKNEMVLKIAGAERTVSAGKTKLLDKDGKPAKLADFAAGDHVKVTTSEGAITSVQKTK